MGRQLPWLTGAAQDDPPAKRQKTHHTKPADIKVARQSRLQFNTTGTQRSNREPSSSPPPPTGPPPILPMDPSDDRYMMVEDEFLDVARLFTAHGDHKALKQHNAQARAKAILPRNIEDMPRTERDRVRREELQANVDGVLGTVREEEPEVEGIWAGTTLGALTQGVKKTSLRGIESVKGDTRAAMGFGPSAEVASQRSVVVVSDNESQSSQSRPRHTKSTRIKEEPVQVEKEPLIKEEPVRVKSEPTDVKATTRPVRKYFDPFDDDDIMVKAEVQPRVRIKAESQHPRRAADDIMKDFDDLPPVKVKIEPGSSTFGRTDHDATRKSRVADVPIFIV